MKSQQWIHFSDKTKKISSQFDALKSAQSGAPKFTDFVDEITVYNELICSWIDDHNFSSTVDLRDQTLLAEIKTLLEEIGSATNDLRTYTRASDDYPSNEQAARGIEYACQKIQERTNALNALLLSDAQLAAETRKRPSDLKAKIFAGIAAFLFLVSMMAAAAAIGIGIGLVFHPGILIAAAIFVVGTVLAAALTSPVARKSYALGLNLFCKRTAEPKAETSRLLAKTTTSATPSSEQQSGSSIDAIKKHAAEISSIVSNKVLTLFPYHTQTTGSSSVGATATDIEEKRAGNVFKNKRGR